MVYISSSLTVLALSFIVAQAAPIQNEMADMIHAQSFSELKHDTFVPMQRLGQDHLPMVTNQYEQNDKAVSAASTAEMPFRPIMVVPLPASVTQEQQQQQQQGQGQRVSASGNINNNGKMMDNHMSENNNDDRMRVATNNNNNKNIYDNKIVGMDDQGAVKTVQLPATIHMPMASASASASFAAASTSPSSAAASTSPSSAAAMAKVSIPIMGSSSPSTPSFVMKNRQNLVGMDDMGKLETLAIPVTTRVGVTAAIATVVPTPF